MNPSTRGSASPRGGGASRQSYSRSASNCSAGDDDIASDFEDEPVPYCQSHMEEIRDSPTPVGNIVDRVQVCWGGALQLLVASAAGAVVDCVFIGFLSAGTSYARASTIRSPEACLIDLERARNRYSDRGRKTFATL